MNGGDTKSHCQERDQERDTSFVHSPFLSLTFLLKASVVMQRLPYPTETVLSNKITRNRIFLSFKDSPRKPLRRRPSVLPRQWRKGDKMYRARERERERERPSTSTVPFSECSDQERNVFTQNQSTESCSAFII